MLEKGSRVGGAKEARLSAYSSTAIATHLGQNVTTNYLPKVG